MPNMLQYHTARETDVVRPLPMLHAMCALSMLELTTLHTYLKRLADPR